MKYGHIISLGGNCEVAHHVRRSFGVDSAMPFDWWILPFERLVPLLEERLAGIFESDNMQVVGERIAVQCRRHGIVHHHDFARDQQQLVVVDAVQASLPLLRAKFMALQARMEAALDSGKPVLFVRAWREILHTPPGYPQHLIPGVPAYDFARLVTAIERCYPALDFRVLFVNYGAQAIDHPRAVFDNVEDLGDGVDWTGSPAGWDAMFARHGVELEG